MITDRDYSFLTVDEEEKVSRAKIYLEKFKKKGISLKALKHIIRCYQMRIIILVHFFQTTI